MDGVGVVRRDQKALGEPTAIGRLVQAKGGAEAQQRIRKEIGVSALLGAAAHLLVVKDAEDRRALPFSGLQEALGAGIGALQIVQARRREILLLQTPDRAGCAGIELQVGGDDVLLPGADALGHQGGQALAALGAARQGQHVGLHVIALVLVGAAIHVDGDVGDQKEILFQVHQPGHQPIPLPDDHTSGGGEGPIQPGGHQHAAVALHAQLGVGPRRAHGLELLELEAGGVGVGGHEHKAGEIRLRDPECDQG